MHADLSASGRERLFNVLTGQGYGGMGFVISDDDYRSLFTDIRSAVLQHERRKQEKLKAADEHQIRAIAKLAPKIVAACDNEKFAALLRSVGGSIEPFTDWRLQVAPILKQLFSALPEASERFIETEPRRISPRPTFQMLVGDLAEIGTRYLGIEPEAKVNTSAGTSPITAFVGRVIIALKIKGEDPVEETTIARYIRAEARVRQA